MSETLGDGDFIGGAEPSGTEPLYVAQLGRISGKALAPNLRRDGIDLTFRNGPLDPDLLYLDVTHNRIGINTSSPVYDLDVNNDVSTTNVSVTNRAKLYNVWADASGYFTTATGPLHIRPTLPSGGDALIWHGRMSTSTLVFNDNQISSISNGQIRFDPNGSGTLELLANTNATGNVSVTGNISLPGDLSSAGTVTIGDSPIDTVVVAPDLTQTIPPGTDNTYNLGKSNKRWSELHSPDWTNIKYWFPSTTTISEQMFIDGVNNKISGIQSNEDILLDPDTGIVYIERTKWEGNEITNLNNTPITFASTGIGYTRFMGTNAFVMPAGPTADQRLTPEVGETRWNTDVGYLECYDGNIWVISTGGGEEVTQEIMEGLGHVYTLILG